MKKQLRTFVLLFMAVFSLVLSACTHPAPEPTAAPVTVTAEPVSTDLPVIQVTSDPDPSIAPDPVPTPTAKLLDENGTYDSKEEVALYLYQYGKLPSNFMTKKQARRKGWTSGALNRKIKGKCIGGDVYSNYEGNLPDVDGRIYYECDINTLHERSRGAERIIYSNDGLIWYTPDHYETFELLYGEEP
ncbi:MAG: ribonuclease domain-containing protein [Erysipelotrichaceae bacterium]|nr:ribonuclease domain-containing protein [Erysipelotrichaceae bacterium]